MSFKRRNLLPKYSRTFRHIVVHIFVTLGYFQLYWDRLCYVTGGELRDYHRGAKRFKSFIEWRRVSAQIVPFVSEDSRSPCFLGLRETVSEDTRIFRNVANFSPNDRLLMFLLFFFFFFFSCTAVCYRTCLPVQPSNIPSGVWPLYANEPKRHDRYACSQWWPKMAAVGHGLAPRCLLRVWHTGIYNVCNSLL